ncbi:molybdopterin synthase sulfur carrier subunit [Candidatus Kryptonium thompsonii]|jgi:molybdopterin synthase sulfur carrier subunit|uniref:Molybdopterin synthase sulfur carrier subunit n=1 Tax=Candidatus Kryptonium thompsonii TaxID=1633631 RepID=A0A0P1LLD7_9BACT|nr:MoaD/ThiS family protein [Candidatus Kryptonium thompsoni]CUS76841.1 molybdopterin synthase sulfur carrier subunit [Candidatus Kryptonium thompsoni]CUS77002.1 molybdopterin synthase sulfur carrier subunit [Candidatus Kryptonium thompsoni]CUS80060.1 molybdopterin synthase sulfur carrier subunit [Candidatus Kryptonium thompsoni]CUS80563.1 molybdopterin synthase sulfur carrier subunit [Candidatus Kryptonium thompsoni]CUS85016.1 molybdopterin synthase sulfur carrier subunit [Candidatus Kryptoni
MKVLFFGRLKEIVGTPELKIDSVDDIESLRKVLIEKFPKLKDEVFAIAVNYEIINGNIPLDRNDEIALLPPIAGG